MSYSMSFALAIKAARSRINGIGKQLLVSVFVLCALVLIAFSFGLKGLKPERRDLSAGMPQQRPTPSKLEAEVIVLRERGFEPAEITRPAGPFFLAVDTRIGANKADLVLSRLTGGQVREQKLPPGKRAWREQVDLPPGKYVLTVADRPNAVCAITITPR